MNPKFREELAMVFPLADTLQMRLSVKDKLGGVKITGEGEFWMELGAVKILLRPKVMASISDKGSASVLVKVQKRLWLYLTYYKEGDFLYLLMLDANAIGLTETTCTSFGLINVDEAVEKLRPGIVGEYLRETKKSKWVPVNDANPVDKGRGELPQEESRITGTPV